MAYNDRRAVIGIFTNACAGGIVMVLDLRGIVRLPGGVVPFDFEPDMTQISGGSVIRVKEHAKTVGSVTNKAGILMLSCNVSAVFECICSRCLNEFELPLNKDIVALITHTGEGENPDGYVLKDDYIDISEIIITEIILDLGDRLLCRDDCAGLCQKCGKNLNTGKCSCKKEGDSRLAVLEQLLD